MCERHAKEIEDFSGNISELEKVLYTPALDITSKALEHPRTVCSDPSCCEKKAIGNVSKVHYKTICHNHCYLQNSDGSIMGNSALLDCRAFNKYERTGDDIWCDPSTLYPDSEGRTNEKGQVLATPSKRIKSETCFECGHSYLVHLTINYETSINSIQIRDENKYERITKEKDAVNQKEIQIKKIMMTVDELEREMKFINKCSAHFARFLMNHTITPFNDALEEYIKCAKSNARKRGDSEAIQGYEKMLDAYKYEKKIVEAESKKTSGGSDLSTDEINKKIKELFNLKHYGKVLQDHLILEEQGQLQSHIISNERTVQLKQTTVKAGKPGLLQRFKFW